MLKEDTINVFVNIGNDVKLKNKVATDEEGFAVQHGAVLRRVEYPTRSQWESRRPAGPAPNAGSGLGSSRGFCVCPRPADRPASPGPDRR